MVTGVRMTAGKSGDAMVTGVQMTVQEERLALCLQCANGVGKRSSRHVYQGTNLGWKKG